jgi:hypothetical protein
MTIKTFTAAAKPQVRRLAEGSLPHEAALYFPYRRTTGISALTFDFAQKLCTANMLNIFEI